jgi:hypothetical protein
MPDAKKLTEVDLRKFTGTVQWHRHGIVRDVLYTDGAKYVADQASAYWLLDEIALAQRGNNRVAAEAFQHWKMRVEPDHTATLTWGDGNGQAVYSKAIPYTDFPRAGNRAVFHRRGDFAAERALIGGMLTMALPASSRSTAAAICGATLVALRRAQAAPAAAAGVVRLARGSPAGWRARRRRAVPRAQPVHGAGAEPLILPRSVAIRRS